MVAAYWHRLNELLRKGTFKMSPSFQVNHFAAPYEVNSRYFGSTRAMASFTVAQFPSSNCEGYHRGGHCAKGVDLGQSLSKVGTSSCVFFLLFYHGQ